MEEEEFQEGDVLWPWPETDTPPPSPEDEGSYDDDVPAAAPELYEYGAAVVVNFSSGPFSDPAASWSASSMSSLLSSDWSDGGGGFFHSGRPSTVSAAGLELGATEEFLEADVLWPEPDTAEDAAEFFWRRRRRSRRVEEAAASAAAAAVFCGKREGCTGTLVVAASSPIDIPMATKGAAAARRRRP